MEFGGNGDLQGNGRLPQGPQPNPGMEAPDINMGQPANVNQTTNKSSGRGNGYIAGEQDQMVSLAGITRIMRQALPSDAKISVESKELVQKMVTEVITFITGEANDVCRRDHRRTVTAEDVIQAMNILGFYNYVQPLINYLHRYREYNGSVREPSYLNFSAPAPAPAPAPALAPAPAPAQVPLDGFLDDPSSAGPSQVAANFEPFWPESGTVAREEWRARGEPSRGEQSRVNDPVNYGMTTCAPSLVPRYPDFFTPAPPPAVAPAPAQVPIDGFLNDPSSAGPSQVAANFEPFRPESGTMAREEWRARGEPSRGEPSRVNDPVNYGMTTCTPSLVPRYPDFFAPAPAPAPALAPAPAPAQVPIDGFLKDPSSAGPSQVAAHFEPFWPEPGTKAIEEWRARGD